MNKKQVILALLLAGALALGGCRGQKDLPGEPAAPEVSGTQPQSEPVTEPVPTQAPTEPVTEPEPVEPVEMPKQPTDYTAEELAYYPYPLLELTYEQITEICGPQEYLYPNKGAAPMYDLPSLQMVLVYSADDAYASEPLPPDAKPVQIICNQTEIYPGIKTGMAGEDIAKMDIHWQETKYGSAGIGGDLFEYYSCAEIDGYTVWLQFPLPEWFDQRFGSLGSQTEEQWTALDDWIPEYKYHLSDTVLHQIVIGYGWM